MNTKNEKKLQIKEDKDKNVIIQNLTEKTIKKFEEFELIFNKSQKSRKIGSNGINSLSSRSHSFITFKVSYNFVNLFLIN